MITVGAAARLLDVTDEWLRRLAKMGYIDRAVRGQYDLVNVVRGYIKFLREEKKDATKTAHVNRMQDAKAAEIELRIAEKKRELIPVEEHHAALDTLVGKVRSEFAGLPAGVTRDMELRRKLEAEVNDRFNRIADTLAALAEFIEKGGELPSGGSADDA